MANNDPALLDPRLRALHRKFIARAKARGITVLTTCTYRSDREQAALYARGRTAPGPILTYARPGKSKHNATTRAHRAAARAFDAVPLVAGKPLWRTNAPEWAALASIAAELGLKWGGDFQRFRDLSHFELP